MERIERYLLGELSVRECREVEAAASADPSARAFIDELQGGMECLARLNAVPPPASVRQRIHHAVERLEHERAARPPVIHPASTVADYATWIDRPEMVRPLNADDTYFIPFADNSDGLTALVWLATGSPEETHTDCIEKFLIVEGSCHIAYRHEVHALEAGDVFSIPLHTPHTVKVTSTVPCKIILQRIAA